jgi:hypothetical protein
VGSHCIIWVQTENDTNESFLDKKWATRWWYIVKHESIRDLYKINWLLKSHIDTSSTKGWKSQAQNLAYLDQAIEVDAIAFSYVYMERFFGVKTRIPEAIQDLVQSLNNRRFASDSSSRWVSVLTIHQFCWAEKMDWYGYRILTEHIFGLKATKMVNLVEWGNIFKP